MASTPYLSDFLASVTGATPLAPSIDPSTSGLADPRITAAEEKNKLDEERKRLLAQQERIRREEEAKKVAEETAQAKEMADQPFKQQMKGREVLLRKGAGDLLGSQQAMQDSNYVLGSGSSLRETPQPIAPEWTKINRASRRLRRQGYTDQAAQMAGMGELERIKTPTMTTQEQRSRMSFMDMEQDAKSYEKKKTEDMYDEYMRKKKLKEASSYDTTPIWLI